MSLLVVRHLDESDPPQFQLVRLRDGKFTDAVTVPPPTGYAVEGRPNDELMGQLRWYLEEFLKYPFHPETDHAQRIQESLHRWGAEAFRALFETGKGRDWYRDATREGSEKLHLQISSDDPAILSWPWEALRDPEAGSPLALSCCLERKLNHQPDPLPLPESLPKDRVRILLVTARPYEADVQFRSISRPLVDLIAKEKLPAQVTLLRPPTFQNLRDHLQANPAAYHLVHFDGHGGYASPDLMRGDSVAGDSTAHTFQGPQGHLIFETEAGQPDPIAADKLSPLLREHRIPAVVLNACQSAMVDSQADDAFASVAAGLLRTGVRSVVAMAYSLYVSGAQEFLPAFYRRLFASGEVVEATRAGRQAMYQQQGRICARGRFPLEDWLVPVIYQQDPLDFAFASQPQPVAESETGKGTPTLPAEASDAENPYGFVGRDGAVLALERALRRPPAGILIHGLAGSGKTTLARGFVHWLAQTGGLNRGCFWFTFNEVRSAEYIFNRMGEALFGTSFIPTKMEQKVESLAQAFREEPFLLVWDNFESARGIEDMATTAMLSAQDQGWLHRLLQAMRGGKTKVLITSRGTEDWLGSTNRYLLPLGGLHHEERWEFCQVILHDLGLPTDRNDPDLVELMDNLEGHPLMMRVVLSKLETHTAAQLLAALRSNLQELGFAGEEIEEKLQATLRFVETSLPKELRPLLVLLSLHQRFSDVDWMEMMASRVEGDWRREKIDRLVAALAVAGLVQGRGGPIYSLHPALSSFLRSGMTELVSQHRDDWARAFVDVLARAADPLAPLELHEQRGVFAVHEENFRSALAEAERLAMGLHLRALTLALAAYALNKKNFATAEFLFGEVADLSKAQDDEKHVAYAYHQLGMVAQKSGDLRSAARWYRKSLEIKEGLGDESGAAPTYHQLAIVAEERGEVRSAARWCRKSLEIEERLGNESGAAISYHELGFVALKRGDLRSAAHWYRKSLEINEGLGNESGAGHCYHQLGIVALERGELRSAARWCRKSLEISERLGNKPDVASTYHELGIVARKRGELRSAAHCYRKSLEINEGLGDESGAALTYLQLGIVAEAGGDYRLAESWYRKSLEINERLGNESGAAASCNQLGVVAGQEERYAESGRWLIRSIEGFASQSDSTNEQNGRRSYQIIYDNASREEKTQLEAMWREAGLGDWPPE